jgi:SAM-dependent methyltransferase
MTHTTSYDDYVQDRTFMRDYLDYQARYRIQVRESDRVIIERVRTISDAWKGTRPPTILDLGCSTGNLLRHLLRAVEGPTFVGADLSEAALDECRKDPALSGATFRNMDIVKLDGGALYDVIIVNAVLYMMNDDEFEKSLEGLARALTSGGEIILFDFFHDNAQHLAIRERSASHPNGLMLHFRPIREVEPLLEKAGFSEIRFEPFEIPIDLERGATFGSNQSGFEDLNSYTIRSEEGRRLLFRGALYQPWCHLFARKG